MEYGIWALNDLYIDNLYASFEELSQKFIIQRSQFFRCKLEDLSHLTECFPLHPSSSLSDLIFKYKVGTKQLMDKIYIMLNDNKLTSLEGLKHRWEGELGETSDNLITSFK